MGLLIGIKRELKYSLKTIIEPNLGGKIGKPRILQFPINDICNSRCQMCDIWTRKQTEEITPEQLRAIIRDDLFSELEGVGVNGGEPTLRRDIGEIVQVLVDEVPTLKRISLITNAYSLNRVIAGIDAVKRACKSRTDRPVHLDVMVSLDGIGAVHDKVRGREGNFTSATKVIDYALHDPLVDSVRIGCTAIRENIYDLENVLDWARNKGIYARFRLGVPHQRLGSNDDRDAFQLTEDERFHFCNFLDILYRHYEPDEVRKNFYRSLRDQIAYGKPRAAGCSFKTRGASLLSNGDFAYCAVESKTLGSLLKDQTATELYFKNVDHLQEIVATKCATCRHDYDGLHDSNGDLSRQMKRVAGVALRKLGLPKVIRDSRAERLATARQTVQNAAETRLIPQKQPRILLCGWYGTETLGDKAIIAGVVRLLQEAFDRPSISVATLEAYVSEHTRRQMPELADTITLTHATAHEMIRNGEFDAVFMAGGPLMAPVDKCLEIAELFACGRSVGLPVGVLGCGIGPLGSDSENAPIKAILEFSQLRLFRDQKSLDLCREMGISGTASSIVDPAWWWLTHQLRPCERQPNQVLFALRDWPIGEYAAAMEKNQAEEIKARFEAEVLVAVETLLAAGKTIIPFCMHKYAMGNDDRQFYQRIFREHPNILQNLQLRHRTPREDFAQFLQAGAALTMRFHSCVFALAAGMPFYAIDYTEGGKVASLMTENDLDHHFSAISNFHGAEAAQTVLQLQAAAPTQKIALDQASAAYASTVDALRKLTELQTARV